MLFGKKNKWVQRIWILLVVLVTIGMLLVLVAPGFFGGGVSNTGF